MNETTNPENGTALAGRDSSVLLGGEMERMTDDWLREQFERAITVASAEAEPHQISTMLRGFANRVLMEFGRDKTDEALAFPFTRETAS